MNAMNNLTDGELISMYQEQHSETAMRLLVGRHHDRLYARFIAELRNEADAKDLQQKLWLQVVRNLSNYKDEGKFAHFLSRIATNLLNDFWRAKGRMSDVIVESRSSYSSDEDDDRSGFDTDLYQDPSPDEEQQMINEDLVRYMVTVLIPALPIEQRIAWLVRHESEYWEPGRRLNWSHMAELNSLSIEQVSEHFESARNKSMKSLVAKTVDANSYFDDIETLVYLVWTQSQRAKKEQQFTWDYFGELLGVPENTMKTRYRAAQKALKDGLTTRMQG